MLIYSPPTEAEQLQFLKNIQRLLNEGSFVASYKFALLHALADLAIVKGTDTGAPLTLAISDIAEKFIELYWQQARPFNARHAGFVLKQNAGAQAAVVSCLEQAHQESQGSLFQYRKDRSAWSGLVRSVASVVKTMPLWKLQTVGAEQVPFLYDKGNDPQVIVLKPGIAYCFRAFYPMLCNLFRSAWIDYPTTSTSANESRSGPIFRPSRPTGRSGSFARISNGLTPSGGGCFWNWKKRSPG